MDWIRKWMKENALEELSADASASNIPIEQCLDCIKDYFDCSICRDSLEKPIQTQCGHVFCGKCLRDLCSKPGATCPLCKTAISNRSLIERYDIGDLLQIVNKVHEVFTVEVTKFLDAKDISKVVDIAKMTKTAEDMSKKHKATKSSATEMADNLANPKRSSKSPAKNIGPESGAQKSVGSKLSLTAKRKSDDKKTSQNVESRRKSNPADDEVIVIDEQTVSAPKAVSKSSETSVVLNISGEPKESKKTSKSQLLDKMMNQTYAIVTADVIPEEPLDLSVSRTPAEQSIVKYRFQESAIRFVKPLDLSKKEKRKFEETVNENSSRHARKASPPRQDTHQRKKGKFEDQIQQQSKATNSSDKQVVSSKGASTKVPFFESSDAVVDFEHLYDDEGSPIKKYPQVFTPTPPTPTPVEKDPPAGTETSSAQRNNAKRPLIRSQHGSSGISNHYTASQIMRDFELPFEDEEEPRSIGPSSGGKVTSSDEIFAKIPEEIIRQKGTIQDKQLPPESKCDSKKNDIFTFKQPAAISQSAKKKQNVEQSRKDDMDVDDDFQMPRDSDLLFLNVSMSGIAGGNVDNNQVKTTDAKSDLYAAHQSRRLSGGGSSDGEKENGMGPTSLSRNAKRKASPVKSSSKRAAEENPAKKTPTSKPEVKRKIETDEAVDDFEDEDDDDEDEDMLLDIPETRKTKRDATSVTSAVTTKTIAPVTSAQEKRYVFCPTRLTKSQTIKLQQLCKMCDGTITKDFTEDVTHLIINLASGRVPQTLKYLLAIAGRKWVVIYEWVEKCVDGGEVISEELYETSNFKNCDPGVKRSRLATKPLFDGYKFYFASEIYKSLGFTKHDVLMLMRTLGATVLESTEGVFRDLIIIGSKNGNTTEFNDWLNTNKWVTVTFEWVIECILEYRLKAFEEKHLCVDASKLKSINAPKSFQTAYSQYLTQHSRVMTPRRN